MGLVTRSEILIREEFSSCDHRFLARALETHLRKNRKNSWCSFQDISTELQQQEKSSLCRSTVCLLPTRAEKRFFKDTIKATLYHGRASPKVKSLCVSRNSRDTSWVSWYWQVFSYLADYKMDCFRLLIPSTERILEPAQCVHRHQILLSWNKMLSAVILS